MKQPLDNKTAKQRSQERLVITAAVGIVLASVVTTLYVSGFFTAFDSKDERGYQNITFTDAVIACEQQTRAAYQSVLRNQTLDDHSSRYDQASNTYKIFIKAKMLNRNSDSGMGDFFINCFVSGSRGTIANYDVFEDKESSTEAIRKNSGGIFGWPIKK